VFRKNHLGEEASDAIEGNHQHFLQPSLPKANSTE
jgi:hypothetical protein